MAICVDMFGVFRVPRKLLNVDMMICWRVAIIHSPVCSNGYYCLVFLSSVRCLPVAMYFWFRLVGLSGMVIAMRLFSIICFKYLLMKFDLDLKFKKVSISDIDFGVLQNAIT